MNKKKVSKYKDKVGIGTRVQHAKFGIGTVTLREGDRIRVEFDEGDKKFDLIAFDNGFLKLL